MAREQQRKKEAGEGAGGDAVDVQRMLEQQRHDAQKLEDQINKQMADHHDRLKDRVKNRRQRQTKIMKQSATAKQALRKKQEEELVAFEAQMISEGNAAEAMRVGRAA